ncbi:Fcf1-domain-containing protein [Desarmillaria tabescens]|uniref:U three protein 23 n=1 Tax=Armillaria tabescens TaxID=1929756 RepID=A0AA39NGU9_ARMTA|nr:Fcf1-domain-containing protein [Desarmillaria tabescens]KAK0465397.1 Fcf1-domain-containing protein [Desarmillaria tabescens]
MRQKRSKTYRKLMALYSMTFGFRQPYQVLIDSEMCKLAADTNIELVKQIGAVLHGEIKPTVLVITQCCIHELYLQGKSRQNAVDLAKCFERRRCNHREPIPGDDCLKSVVGDTNKHRYVIASQSQPLRSKLRSIPAVPLVHINRSVMVLEPPSDTTLASKQKSEEESLHPTAPDIALVGPSSDPPRKKRKGPKGPNPLSVKKKKVDNTLTKRQNTSKGAHSDSPEKKRKRDEDEDEDVNSELESVVRSGRKRKRRRKVTELHVDKD